MARLPQLLAASGGALLLGALALALLGARTSSRTIASAKTEALQRQLESLRETGKKLEAENARLREQVLSLDTALAKLRREWVDLDQAHKALQNRSRTDADALAEVRDELADAQDELTRMRRELFERRSTPAIAKPSLTPSPQSVVPAQIVAAPPMLSEDAPVETSLEGQTTVSVLRVAEDGQLLALDYGRIRGANEGVELALRSPGGPATTVVLTAVRPDFSVGLVLPDQWAADLRQGDKLLLISESK